MKHWTISYLFISFKLTAVGSFWRWFLIVSSFSSNDYDVLATTWTKQWPSSVDPSDFFNLLYKTIEILPSKLSVSRANKLNKKSRTQGGGLFFSPRSLRSFSPVLSPSPPLTNYTLKALEQDWVIYHRRQSYSWFSCNVIIIIIENQILPFLVRF